jgi:hypothetical protein
MHARAVDGAATRLRELRHEECEDLALAAAALGLALAATQVYPPVAIPLFIGGVAVGALGVRALWRHWDLLDRLAGDRDAYVISEIRAYASRDRTMARRRSFATSIRTSLERPGPALEARVRAAAEELEALATELDDRELVLDPACAIACRRLVSDPAESPLLNPARPPEDLRSRVRQIRSGLEPGVADDMRSRGSLRDLARRRRARSTAPGAESRR